MCNIKMNMWHFLSPMEKPGNKFNRIKMTGAPTAKKVSINVISILLLFHSDNAFEVNRHSKINQIMSNHTLEFSILTPMTDFIVRYLSLFNRLVSELFTIFLGHELLIYLNMAG